MERPSATPCATSGGARTGPSRRSRPSSRARPTSSRATAGRRASINFITSHDGFTLRDLVSYDEKHNEANGQGNTDGTDDNRSWNCGAEGPTSDPDVLALRGRQSRALLATLLLSRGVPMLLGGDELGRTQGGNNNAYCQDNETSWLDWDGADRDLVAFTRRCLEVRGAHPALRGHDRVIAALEWFGPSGEPMAPEAWEDTTARCVAVRATLDDDEVVVLVNGYWEPVAFTLPGCVTDAVAELLDTFEPSRVGAVHAVGAPIDVSPRSVVVLAPRRGGPPQTR